MNKQESIRVDSFFTALLTSLLSISFLFIVIYFWGELRATHTEMIHRRDMQGAGIVVQ